MSAKLDGLNLEGINGFTKMSVLWFGVKTEQEAD